MEVSGRETQAVTQITTEYPSPPLGNLITEFMLVTCKYNVNNMMRHFLLSISKYGNLGEETQAVTQIHADPLSPPPGFLSLTFMSITFIIII